ncbi:YktB family protein [Halalkalibacter oceani]|uniref:YktB family protein n=1 Tax=Halalkalibacter oceani TaxID=1653776 RepID=UPI0033968B7A
MKKSEGHNMTLPGFTTRDFDVFRIEGLEERMNAIQTNIQPKFEEIGQALASELSMLVGNEMHLHIARHARRKVNPPNDTWLAVAENKRGYKKHPHFQLGLFDDHLFLWLALIYELPNKAPIANRFLDHKDQLSDLPDDFVLSPDHMKKDAYFISDLSEPELTDYLTRFRDVKKAELLLGRHIKRDDPLLANGQALTAYAKETYEHLLPFYRLAMQ